MAKNNEAIQPEREQARMPQVGSIPTGMQAANKFKKEAKNGK